MSEWGGELSVEPRTGSGQHPHAELVVCVTCEAPGGDAPVEAGGPSAGERLLAQLRQALACARDEAPPIALGTIRCLWACQRSCVVHLRSPGRMGYMLSEFESSAAAARTLLEFASLYCRSQDGVVLVPSWPPGFRGHFLCRVPPAAAQSAGAGA